MPIWPFRRSARAATQQTAPKPRGASGTLNQDGFLVPHEYNPDLRGLAAIAVYDRMRRSDPTVVEALQHLFAPIKNAEWTVQPASDDEQDREVAAFVSAAYFKWLDQPFLDYLGASLKHLIFGHYVFEPVLKVVEKELVIPGPAGSDDTILPTRQFLTWETFAPRLPETIWKWNVERGQLVSIEQQTWKDGDFQTIEIPAENLLVFVNEREGDDFNGISLLRSAYKPWVFKEMTEKIAVAGVERHGVGTNVFYVPEKYENDEAMIARLEEIAKNLRAHEFSYVVMPGAKAMAQRDGFTFEIVSPVGGLPEFETTFAYFRGEIKGALLSRFSELGHANTGARSTGETQSKVWYDALHAIARQVADGNQPAIRRLVDANYSVDRYPFLEAHDIESRNLEEYALAMQRTVSSGAILADRSFRARVRQEMDLPPEDADAAEQMQALEPEPPPAQTEPL